jgi:hypothetical protein
MIFCGFVLAYFTPMFLNVANDTKIENNKMSAESHVYQCAVELLLSGCWLSGSA